MKEKVRKLLNIVLGRSINIRQRLSRLVVMIIFASFASIALLSFCGVNFFRQNMYEMQDEFATSNSEYTKSVIEKTSMATMSKLAIADAWHINRELDLMRHDATVLAQSLTFIMTHPGSYLPQTVMDPYKGKVPPAEPYIIYSPDLRKRGIDKVSREVALTANVKGTLVSMEKSQGDQYAACYFGSKNGYLICSSIFPGDEYSPISDDADYDYDPRIRPWYINAVEVGKPVFSLPYLTILTKEHTDVEVISCSTPYFDSDGIAGVASIDLSTEEIRRFVSDTSDNAGEIRFVMTERGDIVFSSAEYGVLSESAELKDIRKLTEGDFAETISQMTKGESGIRLVELNKTPYYLAYAPIPAVDWSFGILTLEENLSPSIKESRAYYLGLMDKFHKEFQNTYDSMQHISIVIALLLISLFAFFSDKLSVRFARPILELREGVREIAKGKFDHRMNIKTGDEIEELADTVNAMSLDLKSYMNNLSRVTAEKERISTELSLAANIQEGMIPHIFPPFPDCKKMDIYASMEAAKEVGGDFYDFYMVDDHRLAITIADVSGKGIGASLFMVISKTVLKNFVMASNYTDLGELISRVNDQLEENNTACMFVTVFIGVLDLNTGKFEYVNGGHNPPMIYRKNENKFSYLDTPRNFVLGGTPGLKFKSRELVLSPNDALFFYTDGVTEALNEKVEMFGEERLIEALNKFAELTSKPKEFLAKIRSTLAEYVGSAEQSDDITMMSVVYKGDVLEE
ncbi:MAG: SpoIIE family protein phosphatase [Selenomonadaceae bacterium]|nr:SpoIIE family protein phosphatase [Selenomonadaceae bacterium]